MIFQYFNPHSPWHQHFWYLIVLLLVWEDDLSHHTSWNFIGTSNTSLMWHLLSVGIVTFCRKREKNVSELYCPKSRQCALHFDDIKHLYYDTSPTLTKMGILPQDVKCIALKSLISFCSVSIEDDHSERYSPSRLCATHEFQKILAWDLCRLWSFLRVHIHQQLITVSHGQSTCVH
jgi:hypothetical protein